MTDETNRPKRKPYSGWTCPKCGQTFKQGGGHVRRCGKPFDEAAFWSRVDTSGGLDACWPYTGSITTHGYGCSAYFGRVLGAHRIAYILKHGSVPADLQIMHSCDNRKCCNPAHMSLGTLRDNMLDMHAKGRHAKVNPKKLNAEQARQIKALRGSASSGQVAKQFGITQSYVFGIWAGRAWRNA